MDPSSSSSSYNWVYDVFSSFSGEDVRGTFLSHFLKELDRKLIVAFKDNEIERSRSLDPELKQAIRDSRIAVVVFSKNYASSSWCLNELLEIVKCKEEFGQKVIPVFYGLDPSHVRKQTGDFGKIFQETCKNKTEELINRWHKALTDVANILGYHSVTQVNEAKMIEEIANDISGKLFLTTSKEFEQFVGIEDRIAEMSVLLELESEAVRMVGIWGSSGIGKTTIARALFNRIYRRFQGSIFIDRAFISKSMESYSRANPGDYNMKLHLQANFLSKILKKKDIEINHLGSLEERLKHQKVLIFIDDLDDLMVLEVLAGQTQWFGSGSRIVVVTNDKCFLRAHGIDLVYEVGLPPIKLALEMFCRSAFKQNSPPDGLIEFASEVVNRAGSLPLGLNVLGSSLRGLSKEDCINMLPRFRRSLDGKIEKTLRVSYDELDREEDKAIFRHISCLFNHVETKDIKQLLADSELDVDIGLKNLLDKSLIHERFGKVEMHCLLQEMGRNIVRIQSIDEPGRREFLVDSKDICDVLTRTVGAEKVIGISLDTCEIDELHVHENAFKGMRNLRFLEIDSKTYISEKEVSLHLPESFDYLPPSLKLICWERYPMRSMPSTFCPKHLIKIKMQFSKLEKLWEGAASLTCLKEMDLYGCSYLKKIPNLAMAANLETLILVFCVSLVELSSSVRNLSKLTNLDIRFCENLETLPTCINLKSLNCLDLDGCGRLRNFPEISTNISKLVLNNTTIEQFPCNLRLPNLVELQMKSIMSDQLRAGVQPLRCVMTMLSPSLKRLYLSDIPSLLELPSSIQNFCKLEDLSITGCVNLETLPTDTNLESLNVLDLSGCSRLRTFPNISTNISRLDVSHTGIEEIPWWIEYFYRLTSLIMYGCENLETLPNGLNLLSLESLSLNRCLPVKSFPDISTNISWLDLSYTWIKEVPWWIENFSRLKWLYMQNCSKLKYVYLNISKLKHLELVNFSDCEELTGADLMEADNIDIELPAYEEASSSPPDVRLYFSNCFKLDKNSLIRKQTFFGLLVLPVEEVPSYFTYRTTGTSLTNIPLLETFLSRPFFRFRACVVLGPWFRLFGKYIKVCCRFRGRFGNHFDSTYRTSDIIVSDSLVVFDCRLPLHKSNATDLPHLNYDQVDIEFQVIDRFGRFEVTVDGCGIQLRGDSTPYSDNPSINPHFCEGDETNKDNLGGHEIESNGELENNIENDLEANHSAECGNNDVETRRISKRMRIT